MTNDDPYGDDQGTRVGHPDRPERHDAGSVRDRGDRSGDAADPGDMASGNEAARGIESDNAGGSATRPGSEPLRNREQEHEPGYGGKGGTPRTPARP